MINRAVFFAVWFWVSLFYFKAAAHPQAYFQQFSSDFMEVLEPSSPYMSSTGSPYPWWARVVQQEKLKWAPTGKRGPVSVGCDPWHWQDKLQNAGGTAKQYQAVSQNYINQCESGFHGFWVNPIFQSLKSLWIQFDARKYSMGRHVMFHLPGQVKLKGFLVMKGDLKKRPLLILRAGIFSNTMEFFPERSMVIKLFEQSPFNVLMLESLSGSEFVNNNKAVSMVGFDEGLQNYLILRNLMSPNNALSKTISAAHIVALSMGGHGAFYTTLLDSSQKMAPLLSSVLAYCPLVDHRGTTDFHNSGGISKWLMNYYSARRLTGLKEIIPGLTSDHWIDGLIEHLEKNYRGPLVSIPTDINLPTVTRESFADVSNPVSLFWRVNDYWRGFRNVKIPMLVFANPKDPLVPFGINSQKFMDHRIDVRDSDLAVTVFPEGYHCSFPAAYDWSFTATLAQGFIYSTTKVDSRVVRQKEVPVGADVAKENFVNLRFSGELGLSSLKVLIQNGDFEVLTDIPLAETDYHLPNGFTAEEQILAVSRWAHQNVRAQRLENKILLSWKLWQ